MPRHTAARSDRFSASLARTVLTLAAVLAVLGIAAWSVHAPVWVWVCVWPDAFTLVLLLFLRILRVLAPRPDPRLARGRY